MINMKHSHTKNWVTSSLLDIEIDCLGRQAALSLIEATITAPSPHQQRTQALQVVTMNAEMAYAATQDPALLSLLQKAEVVLPDGIGVVWALERQGVSVERVPGIDLVKALLQKPLKVAILGSHPDTLEALKPMLSKDYPQADVVFCHHGYFDTEAETLLIEALKTSGADVLFVALGVPRQEQWIQSHLDLPIPVMIGVGGSFDVISGRLQRAPEWMQKARLEWFFRLLQQPSRWRRMLALPRFVKTVLTTSRKPGQP